MKTLIQVLAHPTSDNTEPAIMLRTRPGNRFIIGRCGEGLQRSLNQYRIRMGSKLKRICLTGQIDWKSIGGLPGMLLTVTEQGAKEVVLQSATNSLGYTCSTWRNFMFHHMANLKTAGPTEVYRDEEVSIVPVAVGPDDSVPEVTPLSTKKTMKPLEGGGRDSRSSCYIVQIMPSRGKFQVDKAKALGVPPGVLYRKLTQGESVTTPDGTIVTPDQVMDMPKVPPRVIVADLPTERHLECAIEDKRWWEPVKDAKGKTDVTVDIKAVYHFLGKDVDPTTEAFAKWVKIFDDGCLHYVSHPDYAPNGNALMSSALLNARLRQFMPKNLPVLYSSDAKKQLTGSEANVFTLHALDVTGLEPTVVRDADVAVSHGKVDWDKVAQANDLTYSGESFESDYEEPQVISLGTGSAMPSKYRNVISTIVRIYSQKQTKHISIVFDAGEGTVGTMRRLYGGDESPEYIKRLQEIGVLYISHLHADHHLGSSLLVEEWLRATKDEPDRKLFIISPRQYHLFLQELANLDSRLDLSRVEMFDAESFIIGQGFTNDSRQSLRREKAYQEMAATTGITSVKMCKAYHCEFAYSCAISFGHNGHYFKVAYSGDTRPNDFFARRVGQNCDLLIHEATHENELIEEARQKRHSTIGEAMSIAREMRAKHTLLTHFSQRYPKLPDLGEGMSESSTAIAFDGLHLRLSDIPRQWEKFDALKKLFEVITKQEVEEESTESS
ncbi:ribonuclease Z [Trichomonascus vanleenenianus]|uniref:tRNase Z n=1 Tax=Trichomonascus vanleenenianus TaxID=2268995 RepID=UPI003ECA354C